MVGWVYNEEGEVVGGKGGGGGGGGGAGGGDAIETAPEEDRKAT